MLMIEKQMPPKMKFAKMPAATVAKRRGLLAR